MDRTRTGLAPLGNGPHQAHLVGLDGRGMSSLAQMFVQRGFEVTGSVRSPNSATDRLKRLGVKVHAGHAPRSISRAARLLVYSPEIPREHPDRLSAARIGVEQRSYSRVVADLLRGKFGIAASGGSKAGVAAAMVGWTLTHAGLDPTVVLGSASTQLEGGGRLGLGPHAVVEDEDGSGGFGLRDLKIVILHDETEPSSRSAKLRQWAESAPAGAYVLGFADERDGVESRFESLVEVERFSLSPGYDWWGADLRQVRGCYRFRAFHRGRFVLEVRLQVPGRHLVLGALAAVAVCWRIDLTSRAIKEALEEFGGISRRFESRGSYRGVTLVDDVADGPLGVSDALQVAREAFGPRRLCAAYSHPIGAVASWPSPVEFSPADRVWIIDGDGPSNGPRADSLAAELVASGSSVTRVSGLEGAIRELDRHLESGDVLVTLGAGDVGTIADAFLRRLSIDRHS